MAFYSEELIEEVLSTNDIVDVISEYVTLSKSGRNFMGLCPFHREKSPSFCVSQDKQIYKCFGCSVGGNVIYFIMKIENLEFWESVEFLANRAHIDLDKYTVKTFNKNNDNKDLKEIIYNINKEAAIYYHKNLVEQLENKESIVSKYLLKRNLDKNTVIKFGIGYATGKIPLYDYLIDKGFEKKDILLSGIIIENENNKLYDRFFKRLIFPIFDIRDRVIAFGGRVLDDSMPKYLNSAENLIYTKGKHLYGLNFVRKSKFDNIIIVEGYMDAVSLQKNGFTNVVASLGTALTIDQARLLKKYTDNIIIAYDSDGAGQDATLRGLDILNANNLNVKVLKLDKEEIKDPDEYVNKYGADKLKLCINKSISLVEFKVSNLEKNLNYDDIQSKINFLNNIAVILSKIDNNIERDIYVNLLSNKYKIASSAIVKEIDKKLNKTEKEDSKVIFSNKYISNVNIRKRQEQYLIALLLFSNEKIRDDILNVIDENIFENVSLKNLYNKIIQLSKEYELSKIDILSKLRDEDLVKDLTDIMYIDLNNIDKDKLLKDIIKFVKKDKLNKRKFEILETVDKTDNIEEKDILHTELSQILIELSKLK